MNTEETAGQKAEETWEQRVKREKAERAEIIGKLEKRFVKILRLLGFDAKRDKNNDSYFARVEGTKGEAGIFLRSDNYRNKWDRVEVHGSYPRGLSESYITVWDPESRNRVNDESITISLNKSDEQIAKEIERRFVPHYTFRLGLVIKAKNSEIDYKNRTTTAIQRAHAVATNSKKPDDYTLKNGEFYENFSKDGSGPRLSVKAHGDTLRLEIWDLDADQAEEIIKTLKKVVKP